MKKALLILMLIVCIMAGCSSPKKPSEAVLTTSSKLAIRPVPQMENGLQPISFLSDFASNWLHQYPLDGNNFQLYPYSPNNSNIVEMGAVWDLNSDGIVNIQDFGILSRIDLEFLLGKMYDLRGGTLTNDIFNDTVHSISAKEIELGIQNFKLFKILAFEANYDIFVYDYVKDEHGAFIIYWNNVFYNGWIDVILGRDSPMAKYMYTYTYAYVPK